MFICQLLRTLGKVFSNIRVRLNLTSENYLKLAKLIRDNIHDELFIKAMYLRKFYPSGKSLLLILYGDRDFYTPLLASNLVTEIVNDLWSCDYKYSLNFAVAATSFKNLRSPIYYRDNINANLPSISSFHKTDSNRTNDTPPQSSTGVSHSSAAQAVNKPLISNNNINPLALYQENSLEMEAYQKGLLIQINKSKPFQFVLKTNFYDYRMFNHIFSYFFWQKSPVYKVLVEAVIYIICFSVIIYNAFEVFRLRRLFESFDSNFLLIIDGLIGMKYGYALPLEVQVIFGKYMVRKKTI